MSFIQWVSVYLLGGVIFACVCVARTIATRKQNFQGFRSPATAAAGLALILMVWLPLLVFISIVWLRHHNDPEPLRKRTYEGKPLAVLRSHPAWPGILPRRLEGRWVVCRNIVPGATIDRMLEEIKGLDPQCHADWPASVPPVYEQYGDFEAAVVFVSRGKYQAGDHYPLMAQPGESPFEFSYGHKYEEHLPMREASDEELERRGAFLNEEEALPEGYDYS